MNRFLRFVLSGMFLVCVLPMSMTAGFAYQAPSGDAQDTTDDDWLFRFELFQGLLEQSGLTPVSSIHRIFANPKQSVVILTGQISSSFPPRQMEAFCAQGGHLLIACDTGFSAGRIAEFQRGPVIVRSNQNRYQGYEDCIVVSDFPTEHPITSGIQQLVLNRTGWLEKPKWYLPEWRQLANLPANVSPHSSQSQPVILQVETTKQMQGRLLVAADHSVFTNGMLWHGDNALFAIQVAEWLAEGKRDQLLFISDGQALAGFLDSPAFQSVEPEITPPVNLATWLNSMMGAPNESIHAIQQANLINQVLAQQPRGMKPNIYRRWLLFAFATAVVIFTVWRFTSTNYNYFKAMPDRTMKSALELDHAELSKQEGLSRAASMLARNLCRELTGSTDSRVWVQQLSKQSLNKRITSLDQNERKRLSTIVDLATNNRTVPVSKKKLEELGKLIQDFRRRHQDLPALSTESVS